MTSHTIYFPEGTQFFNFYTYEAENSGVKELEVPFDTRCPLFILGGKIVHIQEQKVMRSRELNNAFTLMIALDEH